MDESYPQLDVIADRDRIARDLHDETAQAL